MGSKDDERAYKEWLAMQQEIQRRQDEQRRHDEAVRRAVRAAAKQK